MRVRVRFDKGAHIHRKQGKNRHLALAAAALLMPMALMACVLAAWQLAGDLGFAVRFPIVDGPLSHWVIWVLVAGAMVMLAIRLNRYGRGM